MSHIGRIQIDRHRREILHNALLLLREQCSEAYMEFQDVYFARQKRDIDELLGELIQDDWQERHKQERAC